MVFRPERPGEVCPEPDKSQYPRWWAWSSDDLARLQVALAAAVSIPSLVGMVFRLPFWIVGKANPWRGFFFAC
jgi:hypothetical protein